ncbi:MAG: UDP-N-acetylmuramate dehydrogenase [Desulfobacteraceae bacterium]|nr:UDP-N-acetylmuramate dehydrogenase [Desulfobacteraceae bacterium]
MHIETDIDLQPLNTFGLPARAATLIHISSEDDLREVLAHPVYGSKAKLVLGGGSNLVLTQDINAVVLKIEIMGRRLLGESADAWIIETGAGETWHDLVVWTLAQGWPGLENLALIPGTVGAAPVQNIGAYGVELRDRFDALDAVELATGRSFSLDAAGCRFSYRHSIFKAELAGKAVITRLRLRLPKPWRPVLEYPDLKRRRLEGADAEPNARQIFDWVCEVRRTKLPDPMVWGNAGSFFKNPIVNQNQLDAIRCQAPGLVSFATPDDRFKLSAGWLIEACGWKGQIRDHVGVYDQQSLVLINRGGATGRQVLALAEAIQHSVFQRFKVHLEIEPQVI